MHHRQLANWMLLTLIATCGCHSSRLRTFRVWPRSLAEAEVAQDTSSLTPARLPPGIELPPEPTRPSETQPAATQPAEDNAAAVIFASAVGNEGTADREANTVASETVDR